MQEKLKKHKKDALQKIKKASSRVELDRIQVAFLGKKGEISEILRGMGKLSTQERPVVGRMANEVKAKIEEELEKRLEVLKKQEEQQRLQEEAIDVTLPGLPVNRGRIHPLYRMQKELEDVFRSMGFSIEDGPEVETDYYNFEALNVPANHPARDMQDTFYIEGGYLLRTQTSPVQVRTMERQSPPIRIVAPGRCYRVDELDATHSPVFHQMEGLMVDRNISMAHLKGVLELASTKIFGPDRRIRFRPSFFPFTEPSAEVDVSCFNCQGSGCRYCSNKGWLEMLGAGMVNPRVLEMSGIDSEKYTGFAFGMGLDRMAMAKYGIEDIRHLWENDMRFLHQF